MKTEGNALTRSTNRRGFFKKGAVAAGAATLGGSLLRGNPFAFGNDQEDSGPPITRGDIAILRFLSIRSTPPLSKSWMATCLSTFTTTRMMSSATINF